MILMGNGRPEEGHNAVAQHLVDRALLAVHGVHHNVDGRVQEPLRASGSRPSMRRVESLMSAKRR